MSQHSPRGAVALAATVLLACSDGGRSGGGSSPDSAAAGAEVAPPAGGDGALEGSPPLPGSPGGARRLLGSEWDLLGTHRTACSHGSASAGKRWCAFSRAGARLGSRDLWVLDVTTAATTGVACDGSSPACVRLTEDLFYGRPSSGLRYPSAHRFYGDTLILYTSSRSVPNDPFRGTVLAWRPGWPAARAISSSNASSCSAHPIAPNAICVENLSGLMEGQTLTWDLHFGPVDGGLLPRAGTIFPEHPQTQATTSSHGFNPSGDTLWFSTLPSAQLGTESLFHLRAVDVGKAPPTKVADNVSQVSLSRDGARWFYFRDYNYNTQGQPEGTLTTSDFPAGTNERLLVGRDIPSAGTKPVATYQVLVDAAGWDAGLALLMGAAAGVGDLFLLPRVNDQAGLVKVLAGVRGLPIFSPDLRYGLYSTQGSADVDLGNLLLLPISGGASCTLSSGNSSTLLGPPFPPTSSLVFWAQGDDRGTEAAQGWVANPDGCVGARMFSRAIDVWFLKGDELLLYSDISSAQTVDLQVARISGGTLGPPTVLQRQANRTYAILPDWDGVIFSLSTTNLTLNGQYYVPLR